MYALFVLCALVALCSAEHTNPLNWNVVADDTSRVCTMHEINHTTNRCPPENLVCAGCKHSCDITTQVCKYHFDCVSCCQCRHTLPPNIGNEKIFLLCDNMCRTNSKHPRTHSYEMRSQWLEASQSS